MKKGSLEISIGDEYRVKVEWDIHGEEEEDDCINSDLTIYGLNGLNNIKAALQILTEVLDKKSRDLLYLEELGRQSQKKTVFGIDGTKKQHTHSD